MMKQPDRVGKQHDEHTVAVTRIDRSMRLEQEIKRVLKEIGAQGHTVVLALSGGVDSQVLAHCMVRMSSEFQLTLKALGVDHGLRQDSSTELLVARSLCHHLGIPFQTVKVRIPDKGNLMEQARQQRYAALQNFSKQEKATWIVTGHHANDQVETMLLHLCRGTSLDGVGGMWPRRNGLLRPLLTVTREEIEAYAQAEDINYISDPTNDNTRFQRTKIRQHLIPKLLEINPHAVEHWAQCARLARDDAAFLDDLARQAYDRCRGPAASLAQHSLQRLAPSLAQRVIRLWLKERGFAVDGNKIRGIEEGLSDNVFSRDWQRRKVRLEASHLWAEDLDRPETLTWNWPQPLHWQSLDWEIRSTLQKKCTFSTKKVSSGVAFDADDLHRALQVRHWREGDRFQPFGLQGTMSVGDLFTNAKVPKTLRKMWPLVVQDDEILWVIGLRRGSGAPIKASTQNIVECTINSGAGWERVLDFKVGRFKLEPTDRSEGETIA
jgi:tRNA(Ile)-lysidine synthase